MPVPKYKEEPLETDLATQKDFDIDNQCRIYGYNQANADWREWVKEAEPLIKELIREHWTAYDSGGGIMHPSGTSKAIKTLLLEGK